VTIDVEVGGRRRRVETTRVGGTWRVLVDGQPFDIDAARAGDRWSLIVEPAEAGHAAAAAGSGFTRTSHEVAIDDRGRGDLIVHVDGTAVPVTVIDPRAAFARRGQDHGAGGHGPRRIVAPMPGRVVKLLVAVGDHVTAKQGIVVVEAMKMENELRAPRDGRVAEVRVAEGASVEANAVLVVIE
jgi:biotin carboxyl carrier protein